MKVGNLSFCLGCVDCVDKLADFESDSINTSRIVDARNLYSKKTFCGTDQTCNKDYSSIHPYLSWDTLSERVTLKTKATS